MTSVTDTSPLSPIVSRVALTLISLALPELPIVNVVAPHLKRLRACANMNAALICRSASLRVRHNSLLGQLLRGLPGRLQPGKISRGEDVFYGIPKLILFGA
jgi:hypothetical protein